MTPLEQDNVIYLSLGIVIVILFAALGMWLFSLRTMGDNRNAYRRERILVLALIPLMAWASLFLSILIAWDLMESIRLNLTLNLIIHPLCLGMIVVLWPMAIHKLLKGYRYSSSDNVDERRLRDLFSKGYSFMSISFFAVLVPGIIGFILKQEYYGVSPDGIGLTEELNATGTLLFHSSYIGIFVSFFVFSRLVKRIGENVKRKRVEQLLDEGKNPSYDLDLDSLDIKTRIGLDLTFQSAVQNKLQKDKTFRQVYKTCSKQLAQDVKRIKRISQDKEEGSIDDILRQYEEASFEHVYLSAYVNLLERNGFL